MVRVNRSARRRRREKGPDVVAQGGVAKSLSSAGIQSGRVLKSDGSGGSGWSLVGSGNVDASIHTQAEADAHAGLPWSDAHPAPESAVDVGGQELENVGAPNAAGSAARRADSDAVQSNLDTHEAENTGIHGVGASEIESKAGAQAKADAVQSNLDTHEGDVTNPHAVTKSQVGLGSVQNYGIASKAEAEAGSSNTKYMTPLRAKEALNALGVQVATGSYAGNDVDGREIAVGFRPRVVYIVNSTTTTSRSGWMWQPESGGPCIVFDTAGSRDHDNANKQMTANGFTVATGTPGDFNSSETYYWVAYR